MKSSELIKIMKKLTFPSYTKKGRLAYSIIEHENGAKLLKGFYLDSSINKDLFFVQYFVQSLYDPFPFFNFCPKFLFLSSKLKLKKLFYWSKAFISLFLSL